ncbi:hypothetical protein ABZ412_00695 [Nocardia sp. NPDC005746]|uniref:hypothetical protein n=1 Tax=Nocardia sp. NPDC005746 TaxID=3157062 RepID=UPI0033F7C356
MTFNTNVDTIPKEIWDTVRALLPARNMTHREFQAAMGTKFCGSTMWKHAPSRLRLARAAEILDAPELAMLCTNDVFWDRIADVTDLGEQDIFSASVPGTENLVAQGFPSTPETSLSIRGGPIRRFGRTCERTYRGYHRQDGGCWAAGVAGAGCAGLAYSV